MKDTNHSRRLQTLPVELLYRVVEHLDATGCLRLRMCSTWLRRSVSAAPAVQAFLSALAHAEQELCLAASSSSSSAGHLSCLHRVGALIEAIARGACEVENIKRLNLLPAGTRGLYYRQTTIHETDHDMWSYRESLVTLPWKGCEVLLACIHHYEINGPELPRDFDIVVRVPGGSATLYHQDWVESYSGYKLERCYSGVRALASSLGVHEIVVRNWLIAAFPKVAHFIVFDGSEEEGDSLFTGPPISPYRSLLLNDANREQSLSEATAASFAQMRRGSQRGFWAPILRLAQHYRTQPRLSAAFAANYQWCCASLSASLESEPALAMDPSHWIEQHVRFTDLVQDYNAPSHNGPFTWATFIIRSPGAASSPQRFLFYISGPWGSNGRLFCQYNIVMPPNPDPADQDDDYYFDHYDQGEPVVDCKLALRTCESDARGNNDMDGRGNRLGICLGPEANVVEAWEKAGHGWPGPKRFVAALMAVGMCFEKFGG
ncbi:hypothetical protein HDU88_005175 [Geranomyces variabilis]|nr:hypothetical protein HDU88_005175 [Geranomyces variabilis]